MKGRFEGKVAIITGASPTKAGQIFNSSLEAPSSTSDSE